MIRCAIWRARFSSSKPFLKQLRKSCFASRLACLLIFIPRSFAHISTSDLAGGFFGNPALIVCGEDLAGYSGRGLHNQSADFAFQFGEHSRVILGGSLAGLDHDLLGRANRLLGFLFLNARSGGARFLDQFDGLRVRLRKNFLALRLGFRQLRFDSVGVRQPFRDALAPLFQNRYHRLVCEALKQKCDDAKADYLRQKMGPIHAEFPRGIPDHPGNHNTVHKSGFTGRGVKSSAPFGCFTGWAMLWSPGRSRKTRCLPRTRWPGLIARESVSLRRDCVPPLPTPSRQSDPRRWLRPALPNRRVYCRSLLPILALTYFCPFVLQRLPRLNTVKPPKLVNDAARNADRHAGISAS